MLRATSCRRTAFASHTRSPLSHLIDLHPEVAYALKRHQPVVALESAILSHGLPRSYSLALPADLGQIIKKNGAVPASIAILDGRIKVGLTEHDIARVAKNDDGPEKNKVKVSRRDLARALALKQIGGTTVSATSLIAHMVGIDVFVTGGLGGVHRNAAQTMDISADLVEMGRTPTTVVCAGPKSILDIGLTLEYLETQGVSVATYSTNPEAQFPAFFKANSGFYAPTIYSAAKQAASAINISHELGLRSGTLIAVPIPSPHDKKGELIEKFVNQALKEAEEQGIDKKGKELTPWLLSRISELSEGLSIDCNLALIRNNADVGSKIAHELAALKAKNRSTAQEIETSRARYPWIANSNPKRSLPTENKRNSVDEQPSTQKPTSDRYKVAVVGAVTVDITSTPHGSLRSLSTSPGRTHLSLGGVACNIARAVHRSNTCDTFLIAPIGTDPLGEWVKKELASEAISDNFFLEAEETPTVSLMMEKGVLQHGVASMEALKRVVPAEITNRLEEISPDYVCIDANLGEHNVQTTINHCKSKKLKVHFEATSTAKVNIIFSPHGLNNPEESMPDIISLNLHELRSVLESQALQEHGTLESMPDFKVEDCIETFPESSERLQIMRDALNLPIEEALVLARFIPTIILSLGSKGTITIRRSTDQQCPNHSGIRLKANKASKYPIAIDYFPVDKFTSKNDNSTDTGAGDTMIGAMIAGIAAGRSMESDVDLPLLVRLGQNAARGALNVREAVPDASDLSKLAADCAKAKTLSDMKLWLVDTPNK